MDRLSANVGWYWGAVVDTTHPLLPIGMNSPTFTSAPRARPPLLGVAVPGLVSQSRRRTEPGRSEEAEMPATEILDSWEAQVDPRHTAFVLIDLQNDFV